MIQILHLIMFMKFCQHMLVNYSFPEVLKYSYHYASSIWFSFRLGSTQNKFDKNRFINILVETICLVQSKEYSIFLCVHKPTSVVRMKFLDVVVKLA